MKLILRKVDSGPVPYGVAGVVREDGAVMEEPISIDLYNVLVEHEGWRKRATEIANRVVQTFDQRQDTSTVANILREMIRRLLEAEE